MHACMHTYIYVCIANIFIDIVIVIIFIIRHGPEGGLGEPPGEGEGGGEEGAGPPRD